MIPGFVARLPLSYSALASVQFASGQIKREGKG